MNQKLANTLSIYSLRTSCNGTKISLLVLASLGFSLFSSFFLLGLLTLIHCPSCFSKTHTIAVYKLSATPVSAKEVFAQILCLPRMRKYCNSDVIILRYCMDTYCCKWCFQVLGGQHPFPFLQVGSSSLYFSHPPSCSSVYKGSDD